uniref:Rho GTPase activating protein 27 n=1 Tax=Neogobius melanostomus TaxID=47308 RepID=A0A8C6U044_9GOBI
QIQHSHKSRVTNSLNSLCFYFYNLIPQSLPSLGHGGSASSLHAALQDQKLSDWDFHHDTSGRPFYMNRVTLERSWKPPRGREQGAEPGGVRVELVAEDGGRPGRPYFYSADGSRSEWELPKLNLSPPHLTAEGAKTRSLDRRTAEPIVLTKWRHSTHILEPQEKEKVCLFILNMTKITEHGKKVRKNWTSSWTVLQGSTLLFTKGQTGGSSWFGGQSKPELTVDLRGAAVDWAPKDRSSKKHVVELKTRQGTELLIQSDHEALVQDWLQALQESISTHAWESDEGLEDDLPESPGRDDKNDRNQHRVVKNSSSLDVSEDKKTRHRLKRFLTRRPTLQAVRDKGYIKDQVFGCSLSALCQRENSTVPRFVKMCIEHVENDGLSIDGLYRVSGNLAVIQKLRFAVNHDERVNLSDSKWEDIHVTTGALKMFFRDLPEPLFPYGLFHDFVSAIKSPDFRQRVQSIKDLVRQLPEENHDTMQALFRHLRRVVDHGDHNRMTIQSVAIVFGPTLLRPEIETWNMAVHMVYQNQIVELILLECESIFER